MNLERWDRLARLRARGLGLGIVAAAAIAAGSIAGCGSAPQDRSGAHGEAGHASRLPAVTVSDRAIGRPIAPGFVGLSLEYPAVTFYAGSAKTLNLVLVQLIRNLAPGQAPVLRIGGDSTDASWWPVAGMTRPPWVRYALTPGWVATTRALATTLGARLILGINLEANSTTIAASEGNQLVNGIGRRYIQALEIGNEPEVYGSLPWYETAGGTQVYGRPSWYASTGLAAYTADFSAIRKVLPDVPLAGPATGGMHQLTQLAPFLNAEPGLGVVTFHRYPLNRCFVTADSQPATLANLLSRAASRRLVGGISPYVALAHRAGSQFRIDEMNSVACGGKLRVSDTFSSALWALDALFAMARSGVDGVNIHTFPGARYSLFQFNHGNGTRQALVHPEYYGLLMFARAAPAGSRLLSLKLAGEAGVRAWATRAPDGSRRVVLSNDAPVRSRSVLVRVGGAATKATLERLEAPGLRSLAGVTLGGQSFGTATATGTLSGRPRGVSIQQSDGGYPLNLPPASAALLTIAPG